MNLSSLSLENFDKIFIYIDGTNNKEIKLIQQNFYEHKFHIRLHKDNYGVENLFLNVFLVF